MDDQPELRSEKLDAVHVLENIRTASCRKEDIHKKNRLMFLNVAHLTGGVIET